MAPREDDFRIDHHFQAETEDIIFCSKHVLSRITLITHRGK